MRVCGAQATQPAPSPYERATQALDRAEWEAEAGEGQQDGLLKAAVTNRARHQARRNNAGAALARLTHRS